MTLTATTSHTVGPYYHIGLTWLNREDLTVEQTLGERVAITGQVLDGNGDIVNDAMLEVWQANAAGKYDHPEDDQEKPLDPNFEGFGRVPVDAEGRFRFTTIKPGTVEGLKGTTQAPHLVVLVFARGLVKHLLTRIYFEGEGQRERSVAGMRAGRASRYLAGQEGRVGCFSVECDSARH